MKCVLSIYSVFANSSWQGACVVWVLSVLNTTAEWRLTSITFRSMCMSLCWASASLSSCSALSSAATFSGRWRKSGRKMDCVAENVNQICEKKVTWHHSTRVIQLEISFGSLNKLYRRLKLTQKYPVRSWYVMIAAIMSQGRRLAEVPKLLRIVYNHRIEYLNLKKTSISAAKAKQ